MSKDSHFTGQPVYSQVALSLKYSIFLFLCLAYSQQRIRQHFNMSPNLHRKDIEFTIAILFY